MAGYSGTPLPGKLGIEPGMRVLFDGAPDDFRATLGALPAPLEIMSRLTPGLDLVVTFHTRGSEVRRRVEQITGRIRPDGAIWVAWPKRASGVPTDVTEDRLREWFLPGGLLVDVKVCAIDDIWSGLKLVVRKERRADLDQAVAGGAR